MFEITEEMRQQAWEAIGQVVCEGPYSIETAEYEDKPFIIVGSWEALSMLNDAINTAVCPEAWAEWKPVYEERGGTGGPFSGLRIGREGAGGEEISPYLIPDDLLALEELAEIGFSDEYTLCSECRNVIRTQPDCYGWRPDFWLDDSGYLCGDCVRKDFAEDYIAERVQKALEGKAVGCYLLDPSEYGFVQVAAGLENGMSPGQADDPRKVAQWGADNDLDVLFVVRPSQFSQAFDMWARSQFVHPVDVEQVRMALLGYSEEALYGDELLPEFRQIPDTATIMKAALRQR